MFMLPPRLCPGGLPRTCSNLCTAHLYVCLYARSVPTVFCGSCTMPVSAYVSMCVIVCVCACVHVRGVTSEDAQMNAAILQSIQDRPEGSQFVDAEVLVDCPTACALVDSHCTHVLCNSWTV